MTIMTCYILLGMSVIVIAEKPW